LESSRRLERQEKKRISVEESKKEYERRKRRDNAREVPRESYGRAGASGERTEER